MSLINLAPLPMNAPLTQVGPDGKDTGYCTPDWYQSLFPMQQRVGLSPQVITNPIPTLSAQDASIPPTTLAVGSVASGSYRVSWFARIAQAATVSSALTVTFTWTAPDGSILSGSGAALTTNTNTSSQSGSIVVSVKGDTPITYSTTYASIGATPMLYALTILAEFLGA